MHDGSRNVDLLWHCMISGFLGRSRSDRRRSSRAFSLLSVPAARRCTNFKTACLLSPSSYAKTRNNSLLLVNGLFFLFPHAPKWSGQVSLPRFLPYAILQCKSLASFLCALSASSSAGEEWDACTKTLAQQLSVSYIIQNLCTKKKEIQKSASAPHLHKQLYNQNR